MLYGNLVWANEVKQDERPEDIGRLAIIQYSYAEKYWGNDPDSYSVVFVDSGSSLAWLSEDQLEMVDEGGEHLLDQAKNTREKVIKQNTDLHYIVNNWDEIGRQGKINSDTIRFLFSKIGFRSSFERNGEFFILFDDWHKIAPTIDLLINAKSSDEARSVLNENASKESMDTILSFYKEIQQLKGK